LILALWDTRLIWVSPIDLVQDLVRMERGRERGEFHLKRDGSKPSKIYISEEGLILDSLDHGINPFQNWATVVECGDIANTPFDKLVAIHELEKGMKIINEQKPKNETASSAVRLITIGGDHTISKPSIMLSS
jgi:arginase family enzyme